MNGDLFAGFIPHRLFRSGHAQTILAAYAPTRGYDYRAQQHVVELPDGDRLVVHDDRPSGWQDGERVLLMIHGLTGCHGSPYLVRTAAKLNRRGVRTFRLDLRGNGAAKAISRRPGHAGRSGDVREAANRVAGLCPASPLSIVGFSLGANLVLKLLGEGDAGLPTQLDSALAVAPPIDLDYCARRLEIGLRRVYSRAFTKRLIRMLDGRDDLKAEIPAALRPAPRGLFEFDDRVTAPLSGFRDAVEYYERSSSAPLLCQIQLPTLILTAGDDPLIGVEMFRQPSLLSPSTQLVVAPGGGHVGFFGRRGIDPDCWWLDWRIVDWVLGNES